MKWIGLYRGAYLSQYNSEVKICYVVSSSFHGHICDVKVAIREWL